MKQGSHILIKYVVIPIMFICLLVMMDYLSTCIQKEEMIIKTESFLNLDMLSYNLAYTDTHSFTFNSSYDNAIKRNQLIDLHITPIFGKVKAYSHVNINNNTHLSIIALICHLILPIVLLITGLFMIRSVSKIWIFVISAELLLLIFYLIFV